MAISAGDAHTCGLTVDGAAYCWGSNRYGQLGDGSGNDHATPVPVPGGLVFRAISAGGSHTCGVTTTGAAYCWGENESGQVGIGNSDYSNWTVRRPQMVVGGLVFRSIRAGGSHTCGLTTAGATYCWGDNRYGQLGDGTGSMKRASPTAVAGNVAFQAIASGYEHTCGLASGGAMYCWGDNASGQLGDGVEFGPHSSPVATAGNLAFQSVSAATEHTCGLTTGGGAYCWGTGRSAELGDSTLGSLRNSPVAVSGGLSFERVSAGPDHTCAVTAGGAAFCWGATDYHLMYDSSLVSSFSMVPAAVSGGLVFRAISAGGTHSCGLTAGGAAFCWGRDYYGQLGDGTSGRTAFANSPVAVSGGLVFQAISAGGTHTCGLTSDGAAYCWGDNTYGQLGDSTTTRHTSPVPVQGGLVFQSITAGSDLTFGITVDGAAYCWGSNRYGQLGDASGGHTTPVLVAGGLAFRAISVGGSHTCGVTTTGAAYCWGSNESGQVGTGTSGNTVVRNPVAVSGGLVLTAISAGSSHTCGLTVSGASYCWGNNFRYQLGDGTGFSTSPVAVTGGMAFSATAPEASQPLRR